MSNDVVAKARSALEGVTAGPWEAWWKEPDDPALGAKSRYPYAIKGPIDHDVVDNIFTSDEFKARCGNYVSDVSALSDADFEFITAARSLVPELVAEVERLRALLGSGNYENSTVAKGYTAANRAVWEWDESPGRGLIGGTPAMVAQTAVDAYRKAVSE
ncbi:hypothetical protein A7G45_31590 [Mycolicibacterium llatzerense]|nr:hypothetical protein [Mycolicibacterium llatzerense]